MAFTQAKTARIERGRRPVKNEFIFYQRNCVELPNREFSYYSDAEDNRRLKECFSMLTTNLAVPG